MRPGAGVPGPAPGAARLALNALLAFLFPDGCLSCGAPLDAGHRHLCPACSAGLRPAPRSLELPAFAEAGREPAVPGSVTYALEFEGPTRDVIHALKYRGRTSVAALLARAAAPVALAACGGSPGAVVPLPLHPVRLRERGFNQSDLLARRIGAVIGVELVRALERVRAGPSQARSPRDVRLRLAPESFRATGEARGLGRVLLVDDVVTTGATMASAAIALAGGGAREVVCFAVAGTAPAPDPGPEEGPGTSGQGESG